MLYGGGSREMRCFRVDENVVAGIHLSTVKGGLCIEVGDKRLPIDQQLTEVLEATRYTIISKLRQCLEERGTGGRIFKEEELRYVKKIEQDIETENFSLMYADLEKKRVVREKGRSPDALVLVETGAGLEGAISHKSTSFDECIDQKSQRVRREYRAAFPPPGVQIIEEGVTPQGERSYLLRMMPKSSFRIERTGKLPQGAPSVLTVVWKGKGSAGSPPLEVYSPRWYPTR